MDDGEQLTGRFFERAPLPMCVTDLDGRFLAVNDAWARTLDRCPSDLIGHAYLDLVHPDDLAATTAAMRELVRGVGVHGFVNRYRHRDGSFRWLRWDTSVDLEARRTFSVVADVTAERRWAEAARDLEVVSGVGTWELDLATGTTRWSPVTHRIHGTPADDDTALDRALAFYPEPGASELVGALERLRSDGTPYDLELPLIRADGQRRWVRTPGRADDATVPITRLSGTIQDVTDQVEERVRSRRYHAILALSGEGILEVDASGLIRYANPEVARSLDVEDATGHDLFELVDPGNIDTIRSMLGALQDPTRGVVRATVRSTGSDGRTRSWQVAAAGSYDDGELGSVTAVVSDVTDLVEQRRELERIQRDLEDAHRLARLGHWRSNPATGALWWSPMVYEIFGLEPGSDVSLVTFYEAVHPEDLAATRAAAASAATSGDYDHVHRIVRPDGTVRTVHERARMVRDATGQLQAVGTAQDVTEQHAIEAELRQSRALLGRVLAATRDGWWESDLRAGTAQHSDRWFEIHGLERGDVEESPSTWRQVTDAADVQRIDALLAEIIAEGGTSFTARARAIHRDGHLVPVQFRGQIGYDEHGSPVRISGTTTDITDEVRAEAIKDEFLSTVSHELRTPLTSIGGALTTIEAGRVGPVPAEVRGLVEIASRNVDRLSRLIDDLLDMEALTTGRRSMRRTTEPVGGLLEQARADAVGLAATRDVDVEVTVEGAPRWRVSVDANRIQQILANYLANAVKFAPPGSVVTLDARMVDDTHVELGVTDRGPGVPASFRDRAFTRFAQAQPDDPRSRGGTGLGLAISREIAEQHGGRVGYDSAPGWTRFWLRLPLV